MLRIHGLILIGFLLSVSSNESFSQTPPPSSIAPTQYDLNGDGLIDQIVSDPMWNGATGKITLTLSTNPDTPIVFEGVSANDYFGWSVCLIPDDDNRPSGKTTIVCNKNPYQGESPRPEIEIILNNYDCNNFDDEVCRVIATSCYMSHNDASWGC